MLYAFHFSLFCPFQPDPVAQLRRRVETLESQQRASDIDVQIDRLSSYGLRHATEFDKYSTLSMAESLASDAKQHNHPKASFLAVASQTLRGHLQKPTKLFQAYFLALFADKEYSQIWIASLRLTSPSAQKPPSVLPIFRICRVPLAEDQIDSSV